MEVILIGNYTSTIRLQILIRLDYLLERLSIIADERVCYYRELIWREH